MRITFHKENLIPLLAGFFILLTLILFIWSMREMIGRVSASLEPPTGGTAATHYNLQDAARIDYRGNLQTK